jgi:Cytochrome C1 family
MVVPYESITFLKALLLTIAYQDYLFSLLTGYVDPPAGVEVREGMNYNPYFPGGAISMPRVLFDDLVEYDDGMYFRISFFLFSPNISISAQVLPRRPHKWPRTLLRS